MLAFSSLTWLILHQEGPYGCKNTAKAVTRGFVRTFWLLLAHPEEHGKQSLKDREMCL